MFLCVLHIIVINRGCYIPNLLSSSSSFPVPSFFPPPQSTPAKPTTSASGKKEVKPFQRLQFLVRDWQNFDTEYEESNEAVANEEDKKVFEKVHQEMQKYLGDVSLIKRNKL